MNISKAVITAAGPDQRHLPLQTIVNSAGESKTALALVLDEVIDAGIDSIAIIICPGDTDAYRNAAGQHHDRITFIVQPEPKGYGHAVLCARDFTADQPFLLLVGDHLFLSSTSTSCVRQLLDAATENTALSGVQATPERRLPAYGTIGGQRIPGRDRLYEVKTIIEKPTPTVAEQELLIPGLRAGNYLCFFGIHILPPSVMEKLATAAEENPDNLPLTPTLASLANSEKYLAYEIQGQRFNIGESYGLLSSQLAMALASPNRDIVMASIIELIESTRS